MQPLLIGVCHIPNESTGNLINGVQQINKIPLQPFYAVLDFNFLPYQYSGQYIYSRFPDNLNLYILMVNVYFTLFHMQRDTCFRVILRLHYGY